MAQNVYDPYGSDQGLSVGSITKDAFTSPLKPSTYLGMYAAYPGMWSIEKGIWMPFAGKSFEQGGIKAVGQSLLKAGIEAHKGGIAGYANLAKKSLWNIATFGHSTGGYVGQKWMDKQKFKPEIQQFYNKSVSELQSIGLKSGMHSTAALGSAKRESRKILNDMAYDRINFKKNVTEKLVTSGKLSYWLKNPVKYKEIEEISSIAKKGLFIGNKFRTLAKGGLGIGKGVSFIGGAMLAWDLISMVGEPLGRAAIRGLNNTMTEYQKRFMPEVGGRLEMSYLSQGAATERQRAINSISKAYLNARSAFGTEAEMLHKGF